MPRTGQGRGGARQGTPGTAYSNRTDLQAQKVPIMTAPSPQYGTAIAQRRAQQAMPIAAPPGPPGGGVAPSPVTPPPIVPPVPLDAPTQRPGEHVMTGAPTGPGPGPEALGTLAQPPPQGGYVSAQQQIADLARRDPNNQALAYLASKMQVRF